MELAEATKNKREEALRELMRHAVTGHSTLEVGPSGNRLGGSDRSSYHTFCNDPQHAIRVLAAHNFIVTKTVSRSQERRIDAQLESEAVDRFVSEGGSLAPR